jgi:hypothetical protein
MANEPISKDASNPEKAPTKADDGGLARSTLSSCPASPPISEATIAFQMTTCDHNSSLTDDPRMLKTPLVYQTGPKTSAKSGCSCSMREKRSISGRSLPSGIMGIRS